MNHPLPTGITSRDLAAHPEGIQIPGPSFLYQKYGSKGRWGKLMLGLLNRTMFRRYPNMYRKYRRMGFMTPLDFGHMVFPSDSSSLMHARGIYRGIIRGRGRDRRRHGHRQDGPFREFQ